MFAFLEAEVKVMLLSGQDLSVVSCSSYRVCIAEMVRMQRPCSLGMSESLPF